ncbi:MAG: spermine synthase, partial [Zetaproteobacteria bacterium]
WAQEPRLWALLPVLLLLAWPVMRWPPVSDLLPGLKDVKDLSVYEDAVALTHVVERADGQRLLLSDLQRMDASSDPLAVVVQRNQARLPLLLHPGAESILFLGLGTGITASGSLPFPSVKKRVSVELSQGAIRAAETYFRPINLGVLNRLQVIADDGRRYLRSETERYDVIVGDLFHPDMVGRANLLSLQQFRRVRARLAERGVFVQWLALNQFDVRSLKVILATFLKAFGTGHAVVFVDGYRLAMVGFMDEPFTLERLLQQASTLQDEASGHEGLWTWLGRCWGEVPKGWLQEVPMQDEWSPVIEYALPRVRYEGGVDMVSMWRWLLQWRSSDEEVLRFWHAGTSHHDDLVRARAGSALDVRMWLAELDGDERRAIGYAKLARRANTRDRWPSLLLADRMFDSLQHGLPAGMTRRQALVKILDVYPWHEGALRDLWRLDLAAGKTLEAQRWHDRLAVIAPLAIDVRSDLH